MSTFHDSTSKFQYKPLDSPDSIRILLLHPSSASPANLYCDLIQTTISACDRDLFEHYVALSYVWGSTNDLQTILLERRHFQITRNLSEALHNIRESSRAIRLWVDAICINQQDDSERNQQVALMGKIYSIARHTIIYLGHSTPLIDVAFRDAAELEVTLTSDRYIYSEDDQGADAHCETHMKFVAGDLLRRAWFTRIWVFQELVLSRDPWVQCAKSRLKWAAFCNALLDAKVVDGSNFTTPKDPDYIVPERPNSLLEMLRSLQDVRNRHWLQSLEQRRFSAYALVDLVRSRRGLGATDPRDIIFGHISLAPSLVEIPSLMERPTITLHETEPLRTNEHQFNNQFNTIMPAYHKSVEEVFMDFAYDVIKQCGHLGIFYYKESLGLSERRSNLASWAPDWSVHPLKQPQLMMEQIWELQQPYRGTSPHCWVPDSRLLLLSASRPQTSETILEVSPVILWHATDIMLSEDYQELLAKDLKSFLDTFSNDYPSKKGWCADLYENVYAHYSEMLGRQFLPEAEFRRTLGLRTHLEEIKGDFDFDLDACLSDFIFAHAFDAKKRSTLAGRRLASLTGNRTALVPPMAQAGDVIYRIDRISQELPWDGTFVFRSLSRELADSTTHEMSVPQMEALDEFRQTLQLYSQSQGQGTISEEYQHCILLGQSRIFERGRPGRSERRGVRRLDWSQSQLLVVH